MKDILIKAQIDGEESYPIGLKLIENGITLIYNGGTLICKREEVTITVEVRE